MIDLIDLELTFRITCDSCGNHATLVMGKGCLENVTEYWKSRKWHITEDGKAYCCDKCKEKEME